MQKEFPKVDLSLIRSWHKAKADGWQVPDFPFIAHFARDDFHLCYLAAQHGGDIESPTLKTVRHAFDAFSPSAVVVEGFCSDEVSREAQLDHCRRQAESGFREGGESAYAVVLASERGIPFIGGEPSSCQIYNGFLEQGYTLDDFLAWQIGCYMKMLPSGDLPDSRLEDLVREWSGNEIGRLSGAHSWLEDFAFDLQDFRRWYADNMDRMFSMAHIMEDDISPSFDCGTNRLQHLMAVADHVREPHIVDVIASQLAEHRRVLTAYGGAHLGKQEKLWRKAMGTPVYKQPFTQPA